MKKIKWIDENLFSLELEFNQEISIKLKKYYTNSYHISNPVLSRNIGTSRFFEYFCSYRFDKTMPKQLSIFSKIKKLSVYYIKSIIQFILILCNLIVYKTSYKKRKKDLRKDKIVLIDTFTMIDRIYPNGYKDNYYGDLINILKDKKNNFAILAILFGDKPYNLRRRYETYKLLNKEQEYFLSEFEFLKFADYIQLFIFMMKYPLYHLSTKESKNSDIEIIYNICIDETLDLVQINNYIRYLYGKRLGEYFDDIKLITWDENQVIHKLLNKGLRDTAKSIYIYGTKFYGILFSWIHVKNLKIEKDLNISPDITIVKGKYYESIFNEIKVCTGWAPREQYLHAFVSKNVELNNLGILLGYDIEENARIIDYIQSIDIKKFDNIIIRLHPNHKLNTPFDIPNKWTIDEGTLVEFSDTCNTIVSVGTGAALEMMLMNNFIALLGGKIKATATSLPNEYKHANWDIFYSKDDLEIILDKQYENSMKKINLDDFFQKSTDKQIIKSLGL